MQVQSACPSTQPSTGHRFPAGIQNPSSLLQPKGPAPWPLHPSLPFLFPNLHSLGSGYTGSFLPVPGNMPCPTSGLWTCFPMSPKRSSLRLCPSGCGIAQTRAPSTSSKACPQPLACCPISSLRDSRPRTRHHLGARLLLSANAMGQRPCLSTVRV